MNEPTTAPLTFGQLSLLRSLQHIGPEGATEVNLVQVWPLPSDMDGEAVDVLWYDLLTRNESLRATYEDGPAGPVQVIHPVDRRRLDRLEMHQPTEPAVTAHVITMAATPFAVEREQPWRAVVVTDRGQPRYLAVVLHHIAVDMVGCALLRRQFDAMVAGAPLAAAPQPAQLAARQHAAVDERRQVREYWARAWGGFVPEDRRGDDRSERIQAALHTVDGLRAAQAIADRTGVPVQAAVLGAAFLVLCRLKNRDRATLGLMTSNRFDAVSASVVSTMNQLAPLTVTVDDAVRPDTFLCHVFEASLEAYAHGCYNVDELRTHLAACGYPDPDPMSFDCFFNFLGDGGRTPDGDGTGRTTLVWQPPARRTGPSFSLLASTGSGLYLVL